ncbi:HAD family phosphatase [Actinosynnema sp. NPDC023658]|uniref:HAD family hydrolase n=1 Tax=Actinosynnema sp. NPDC023658 TaxID=3155465 RepID=UPI0034065A47
MTTEPVSMDQPEVLHAILMTTDALFLDFDGPICSIFASLPAHHVASQLRKVLADGGHQELPAEIEKTEDPFDVFSYAATLGTGKAHYLEAALRAHEVEAVATAEPTLGAHDLIHAWHATGRKLAVVSNNSQAAVNAYLHLHNLVHLVHTVSARTEPDPAALKPSPQLIDQAAEALTVPPSKCTLVGDSLTDLRAANAAGTRSIGYANKPGKAERFATERPSAITTSMATLDRIVRSW